MVRIPRYEGSLGSSPIRSGRNIRTGTSGANALMNLGKEIQQNLNQFGEQKIALQQKIRDQEIRNKGLLAQAETNQWIEDEKQRYEARDDYEMFGSLYEKDVEVWRKELKKKHFTLNGVVDEIAWNAHLADMSTQFVTGKIEVNKIAKKKFNHKTITAYETTTSDAIRNIGNSTTVAQAQSFYRTYEATYLDYKNNEIFDPDTLNTAYENVKKRTNEQLALFAIGNGTLPTYQNEFGDTTLNAREIASQLGDKNFNFTDVDGNSVPITSQFRQDLITNYTTLANTQSQNDEAERNRLANADNSTLTNKIIDMKKNNKLEENYIDDVRDSNATPARKDQLVDDYLALQTNMDQPYVDTQAGRNTEVVLNNLIDSGAISYNDPNEMALISNAYIQNLIDQETYNSMQDKAENVAREKGKIYVKKTIAAARTIAKRLGNQNLFELMEEIQQDTETAPEDRMNSMMALLDSNADHLLIYEAVNNMNEIVEGAVKKGIPIDDLLTNVASENYIVDEIIEVYENKKFDAIQSAADEEAQLLLKDKKYLGFGENEFRIKPKLYLNTLNATIPTEYAAIDGETIEEYVNRVGVISTPFGIQYFPDTVDVSSLTFKKNLGQNNE
tara:strand:+ start:10656 stop:12500 length:1845 start_codon:yes stop_codon:yes gene_type:complete